MKEEDIRKEAHEKKAAELKAADSHRLLVHSNKFVYVKCPACESGSNRHILFFKKGGFTFVSCTECETVFINPRPTVEMLTEYYFSSEGIKFWNETIYPDTETERRQHIVIPRVERIRNICQKHNVEMKTLVDVGAGFGTFCEEIAKASIFENVIAVEPSPSLAQTCIDKGLDVIDKPIEETTLKEVSVIT
jgi:ribosomal protein S27E